MRRIIIIDGNACITCYKCTVVCPTGALIKKEIVPETGVYGLEFIPDKCNGCLECVDVCPVDAIEIRILI